MSRTFKDSRKQKSWRGKQNQEADKPKPLVKRKTKGSVRKKERDREK